MHSVRAARVVHPYYSVLFLRVHRLRRYYTHDCVLVMATGHAILYYNMCAQTISMSTQKPHSIIVIIYPLIYDLLGGRPQPPRVSDRPSLLRLTTAAAATTTIL